MAESGPPMTTHLRWWPRPVAGIYAYRSSVLAKLAAVELVVLAVLAHPAVANWTGVGPGFLSLIIGIHFTCMALLTLLAGPVRRHPALFHVQFGFALTYNIGLTLAVIVHSGDFKSPWWYAYIMYAGLTGALQDVDAARLVALIFAAAPLISVPLFARQGLPADQALASAAVAGGMAVLGYLLPAMAQQGWRAERDLQERKLKEAQKKAAELEREALSRDLHDSVGSKLAILALYGELLQQGRVGTDEMTEVLQCLRDAARQGLQELRDLLTALGPEAWTVGGLAAHLRDLAQKAQVAGIETCVDVHGTWQTALPALVALVAVRVSQEAVSNALRHGRPSQLTMAVAVAEGVLTLEVRDNGCGFVVGEPTSGRGLTGMARRVAAAGGQFTVESRSAEGTTVRLELPMSIKEGSGGAP